VTACLTIFRRRPAREFSISLSRFMTLLTRFCGAVIKRSGRSFTGSSAMAMKSLPRWARSKPSSLAEAHGFLQRQGLADLRICGLNAFNPQEGALFLPRLEWRRVGGSHPAPAADSETSLREDASAARAFLQALTPDQAQPAALPPVLSERTPGLSAMACAD
jgi:hypothetical protein